MDEAPQLLPSDLTPRPLPAEPVRPGDPILNVPSAPFRPRRGLRGPHRQTLASQFLIRRIHLPAAEKRLFQVEPEVQVLCRCHWQQARREALTLLIVHGLEGSSESQYVLGTTAKALAAGLNVVRMNVRNCGGTETLGPTLYHSGLSADVSAVVGALLEQEKLPRLALLGFSMGGNLVLKLAGEWGREAPPELRAVCAISPAVDLAPSAAALHRPGNWVYEQYFLWNLRRRLRHKSCLYPGRYQLQRLRLPLLAADQRPDPAHSFPGRSLHSHPRRNRSQAARQSTRKLPRNLARRPLRLSGRSQRLRWTMGGAHAD